MCPTERYWLIWDGECGFCRRSVAWVERRDTDGVFRTVPFQEAPSPPLTPELYERARRSVQVVKPDGEAIEGGAAAALVLSKIGWTRTARLMTWKPMRPLVEWGYRWVARNRGWLGRVLFRQR